MHSTGDTVFAWVFGLGLLAWGIWDLRSVRKLRARGIRVPGVVVGSEMVENLERPVFRFTTIDGQEVEVTSAYGQAKPLKPGDRVTVRYDPENVQNAHICTRVQEGTAMGWVQVIFELVITAALVLEALGGIPFDI